MSTPTPSRIDRLRPIMAEGALDALVYGVGANFQYFSGLVTPWRREAEPAQPGAVLVVDRDAPPGLLLDAAHAHLAGVTELAASVYADQSELTALLRRSLSGNRVGTSRSAAAYLGEQIRLARPSATCVDGEALGEILRIIKEPAEIARLRRAAALTDRVMAAVVDQIRPGVTQNELSAMIERAGRQLGAQDVSFPPAALFVKSGTAPTPEPFVYPADEPLVQGTSVAFDFGFVLDGYCSDFGRSFYAGPAPEKIAGAYRALQESQQELISRLKPGAIRLNEMFDVIAAAMDRRGYGDRLRARLKDGTLGHQIGVDLHEDPWLRHDSDVALRPGMVMAIEPKAWSPGEYYLRVEDMVLITAGGAESLTSFDRDLFELPI